MECKNHNKKLVQIGGVLKCAECRENYTDGFFGKKKKSK